MLISQITTKQPLALSLAQSVRACHFKNDIWLGGCPGPSAIPPHYLANLSYMSNIRQLTFSYIYLDELAQRVIVSLASPEELCLQFCHFRNRPANATLEDRAKIKVFRLDITNSTGNLPVIYVDALHLHVLSIDTQTLKRLEWFPQSALTELCIGAEETYIWDWKSRVRDIYEVLKRAPRSIEMLSFWVDVYGSTSYADFQRIFDVPGWSNFPRLYSLNQSLP